MSPETAAIFRALGRASRPIALLGGLLFYALGGGIASYLGAIIDWPMYWVGQGAVTMLQLSASLLREYFDRASQPPFEPLVRRDRRPAPPPAKSIPPASAAGEAEEETPTVEIIVPRVVFFQAAAAALTTGAVLTVLLYASGSLSPAAFVFIGIAFLLSLAYAVPPLRLVYSGYGELVQAVLVANLFPALAYLIQEGDLHGLLALMTLPLTLLVLAARLARSLQHFMDDIRRDRQTLLVRAGWERGIFLHNALIAMAYLALAAAVFAGLPRNLGLPAFLSLPVAVFQVWQINGIAAGAKPRWRLLALTALASAGLAVYFMNLALWTG
jgi:1,4-dihydroxy-2-naphthoate octaprenyltransferase